MEYAGPLAALGAVHLLGAMSPGPNFLIVSSTAMHHSRRAGLAAGLGVTAGSASWSLLTIAGLGLVMAQLPWLYDAVRLAGAAYLVWIGTRMAWTARAPLHAAAAPQANGWASARKAWLVNMTNPKSLAYYASVFAVMVPSHAPAWVYATAIAMTSLISCLWYCGVAWLLSGEAVRGAFLRARPIMQAAIGVFLLGLGVRMLVAR